MRYSELREHNQQTYRIVQAANKSYPLVQNLQYDSMVHKAR